MNKLFMLFGLTIFLIGIASANLLDIKSSVSVIEGNPIRLGGNEISFNPLWNTYQPIEISSLLGLGGVKFSGAITEHTDSCSSDCSSTMNIYIADDMPLVDEVTFYTIEGEERIEQPIRSYQFYIQTGTSEIEVPDYAYQCSGRYINGTDICGETKIGSHFEYTPEWKPYNLGEILPAGNYVLKLEGQKKASKTIDWVITTRGMSIDEWATWASTNSYYYQWAALTDLTGTIPANSYSGVRFLTGTHGIAITSVIKDGSSGFKNVTIRTSCSGGTNLGDADFSGNTATFASPIELSSNTAYFILGSSDANYQYKYYGTGAMPVLVKNDSTLAGYDFNLTERISGDVGCSGISTGYSSGIQKVVANALSNGSYAVLNSPIDGYISNSQITFNSTAYYLDATAVNVSLWTNSSSTFRINQTINKTGTFNESIFYKNFTNGQYILWNIQWCDSDGVCSFAGNNRTLKWDNQAPQITLLYPSGTIPIASNGQNISLNYSITDLNLQACWYNYNGTNMTANCTANASLILGYPKTILFYANDTTGSLNTSIFSWNYTYFVNYENYSHVTYETAKETYSINVSGMTIADLFYNGTKYSATISHEIATKSLDISLLSGSSIQKNFYWNINGHNITQHQQNVSVIQFAHCNSSLNVPYLNLTFKDESTSTALNSSIDASDWEYYLQNGAENIRKTYQFVNTPANKSYGFCFTPSNKNIVVNTTIKYSDGATYPQRQFRNNFTLSNVTTNQTLWLLSTTDGATISILVSDRSISPIEGALISISRSGYGIIDEKLTDSSGTASFWLNPDFAYSVTASKSNYGSTTVSITPTQSSYTITLGTSEITSAADYTVGIKYSFQPLLPQLAPNTIYSFNFTVSTTYFSIDKYGINVTDSNGYVIGYADGTNSGGGTANISINTGTNNTIGLQGFYVVNGTYIYVGHLVIPIYDANAYNYSIMHFFDDLNLYLGDTNDTDGLFGLRKTDDNGNYSWSLALIIFVIVFVSGGIMSYRYGFGSALGTMVVMTGIVYLLENAVGLIRISSFPFLTVTSIFATLGIALWEAYR